MIFTTGFFCKTDITFYRTPFTFTADAAVTVCRRIRTRVDIPAVQKGIVLTVGDDHFAEVLNTFLKEEKPLARRIFLRRYWYMESVEQIASRYGVTKGSVKSNLFRSRERFRSILEREGLWQ